MFIASVKGSLYSIWKKLVVKDSDEDSGDQRLDSEQIPSKLTKKKKVYRRIKTDLMKKIRFSTHDRA